MDFILFNIIVSFDGVLDSAIIINNIFFFYY